MKILEKAILYMDRMRLKCPTVSGFEEDIYVCSYIPFCKYQTSGVEGVNRCQLYNNNFKPIKKEISKVIIPKKPALPLNALANINEGEKDPTNLPEKDESDVGQFNTASA